MQKSNLAALARMLKVQPKSLFNDRSLSDVDGGSDSIDVWPSQWNLLKGMLAYPECDIILSEAPSLRNKIRISQRIETLVPVLWEIEVSRKSSADRLSTWARLSYTLGLPNFGTFTDLFIRNSSTDICVRVEAFTFPESGQLAGLRFWYESPSECAAFATSRTLGTWIQEQDHPTIETKGKQITGAVLSLDKSSSHQGIVGFKVRPYSDFL